MVGKDCVAIATDMRFGIKNQTIAFDHPKVYRVTETCLVGLPGLISDAQTVYDLPIINLLLIILLIFF